jgi:hypothetical protein
MLIALCRTAYNNVMITDARKKILTRRINGLVIVEEVPIKTGKSINGSMVDKVLKALLEFSEKKKPAAI